MNLRSKTVLLAAGMAGALFTACIDRSLDVGDPDYPTEGYRIAPDWSAVDTNNLRPMALYRIPVTLGKERFRSITARCNDETILDTALLDRELDDNRLSLYFLRAGVCTLTIDGLHPNDRHTVIKRTLRITNPYRITGDTLLGLQETSTWELVPRPLFDSTGLDLLVEWRLDSAMDSRLPPGEPFLLAFTAPANYRLLAHIVDTLTGHGMVVDSIGIRVPGHRPVLDSLVMMIDTLVPGQQPQVRIFTNDRDSGSLTVRIASTRPGLWNDSLWLTGPVMYSSILTARKPVIDTGVLSFTVAVFDPTGLRSPPSTGSCVVTADPPRVRFVPDTAVIALIPNLLQTLLVSATADTFVWNIDGEDTVTDTNQLTRMFLTDTKKTANVSVLGIDRYGYRGPMASIRIVEETSVYDLLFSRVPGDSVHRNGACWTVRTSRHDRVREYGALFYWELFRSGDTLPIYRVTATPESDSSSTLCLSSLTLSGMDSIDVKVSVVLKDSLGPGHSSPVRIDSSSIRPFRPTVSIREILPRPDSIAAGQEAAIRFSAQDVNRNGAVDSVFWKTGAGSTIFALPASADSLSLQWNAEGPASILLWARDNDGEISDTARVSLVVVRNRPSITGITLTRPVVYALERCTLSVACGSGILKSPVAKTVWQCSDASPTDTAVQGTMLPLTFATPGKKTVTVVAIDARGDSSLPVIDTVTILSGKPVVTVVRSVDSVSTRIPATFTFSVSSPKSTVDTLFWGDEAIDTVHTLALPHPGTGFTFAWTEPGERTLHIWVKDGLGDRSDTLSLSIVVIQNRPVISQIIRPGPPIYTHRPCTLEVAAAPGFSGSRVVTWLWQVQGAPGPIDTQTNAPILVRSFETPGVKLITVSVRDSIGDTSATWRDSVVIDPGKPVVTAVTIDTTGGVWVNDRIVFIVNASDPNGSVAQYRIVLKRTGSDDSLTTLSGSREIPFIQPIGNEGEYAIYAYARDNDSLWSTVYLHPETLSVRAGKPSITAAPAAVWIYDTLAVVFTARDTNGSLINLVCDWADGAKDTTTFPPTTTVITDALRHRYTTHGTKTVRLTVSDDDGQGTVVEVPVTINRGTPWVEAARDTFVWFDDRGAIKGDTINLKAAAADSNGTITRYVWVLTGTRDTNGLLPDTVMTAGDSLVMGAVDNEFWSGRNYLRPLRTYTGEVMAIDNHDFVSAPDTFRCYVDAPRTFTVSALAKEGFSGDQSIFELIDGTARKDSLVISLQGIAPGDTNYLSVTIALVVDSITDFTNPAQLPGDTIHLAETADFTRLTQFLPRQSNYGFICDSATKTWRLTYRPPVDDFRPYKQTVATPRPWLFFHVHVAIRTRTGAVQIRESGQLQMGYTLFFID